jgi:hypothetical protein
MAEPFEIKKALDLSLPAMGKSVSVVIKGLLVLALVASLGWGVYVVVIKPHIRPTPTSTTNQSGTITNNNINPNAKEIEDIISNRVTIEIKKQRNKRWFGFYIKGVDIGVTN